MIMHSMFGPFPAYAWASSWQRIAMAMGVTVAFGALARLLRGVNRSGAWAGSAVCLLMFAGAGPAAFAALAGLFLVTWIATRWGYRRKLGLGLAEPREGRAAGQVLANLAVPALVSVVFAITGNRVWLVALLAALSESATDTAASEIGQYKGGVARMITTWKPVQAGTDGGVTLLGSVAGMAAGLAVSAVGLAGGLLPTPQLWIPLAAGFAGMLFDSLLGATLQRRGWIGNQMVNLFATVAAAALAYCIWIWLRV